LHTYSVELTGESAKQLTQPESVGISNGDSGVSSLLLSKRVRINFPPLHNDHKYGLANSLIYKKYH
jgi:hypothetical protein